MLRKTLIGSRWAIYIIDGFICYIVFEACYSTEAHAS